MKCPYCDVEILHGYLQGGMMIWSEKKHTISLLPNKKEKYALYLNAPIVSPNSIESDCCPQCKKIIIDSSIYGNNL